MPESAVQDVEIRGHIIDSLILPKILDLITTAGARFRIKEITVGQSRSDPSFALVEVAAKTEESLADVLATISDHGATAVNASDCTLVAADIQGAFPEGFYSSTNQQTEVRIDGEWLKVEDQEMDCGIYLDDASTPRCLPMNDVQIGQRFIVGHAGVRVSPTERAEEKQAFEFMNSAVSTEKPKGVAIRQVAEELVRVKRAGGKSLIVGGPAIVHSGSGPHLCELIAGGYIHLLFAGNALATHDIEQALFGTSLGVRVNDGDIVEAGHEHHLRAINRIRRLGGIAKAVQQGELTDGVMHACVSYNIPYLLAGSIRDDGPLPEVITDAIEAQNKMRQMVKGISFCLMVATTLHSIAVGNLLPAWVRVVCVDINPSTVIKLSDRGSFQTIGIVTDVEPFMRSLVAEVKRIERE